MSGGYPKITSSGHARAWTEQNKDWYIEEKIDGSQLSFVLMGDEIHFFNRGKRLTFPYGWFFDAAISALHCLKDRLIPGCMYHGECIAKPKHNVVCYGRVPRYFFLLFDVQEQGHEFVNRNRLEAIAEYLGVERVQLLYKNTDPSVQPNDVIPTLDFASQLGGPDKPEGVVLKHPRYQKKPGVFSATKIKYVRDEFKEVHRQGGNAIGNANLTCEESLELIMSWYPKEARWNKARQRLRDRGEITGEPENTNAEKSKIREEARRDFQEEEQENLKNLLWAVFGKQLVLKITEGL